MATTAAQRQTLPRWQAWLATNWPAALWLLAAGIVLVVVARMTGDPSDVSEMDEAEIRRTLTELHLLPSSLYWFAMVTGGLGMLVELAIGWLLVRRAPRTFFTAYLAFVFLADTNVQYPPYIDDALPNQPIAQAITRLTTVIAISGFFMLPFIFPDGRFVPRWTVAFGAYVVYTMITFAFFPSFDPLGPGKTPVAFEAVATVLFVLAAIGSMVYRYRKVSTPEQRRQTRWVMFGLMIAFPGFFVGDALMRNIDATPVGVVCLLGFLVVMPISSTLPHVTIGIAILRHRLFDIDVILSRTLVWLVMTAAVTGTYVGVVVGIGGLIGSRRNLLLSLLATGLVAVGFQPLRQRVQRLTDRLLFGERDDPYAVLSRLGHQIEDALNASDLLSAIVRTTVETLRLPYAALFLERTEGPVLVASSGVASTSLLRLPLTYQGQAIGTLEVATRTPGEVFGPADRRLLEDLARQIGVVARTVGLADDLQRSRERIVTGREEERRRLRRDLHDGLGPQLAAMIMQAGAVRTLLRTDPDAAEQELAELREELRAAVADVRRLVLGLRPPALDELGLVGALRTRLARLDGGGIDADSPSLRVDFEADEPLPLLSAAAEVAAFRIVEEAVTNVVKHARAARATVSLRMQADSLAITVVDDGVGIAAPLDGSSSGLGLQSMRERATEIGGTCSITAGPDGRGTVVRVVIPTIAEKGAPA